MPSISLRKPTNAARPCAETACRIEARVRPVNPPERLQGNVFGGRRVADQANHPAVDVGLVTLEQRLERLDFTPREPLETFHGRLHHTYCRNGPKVSNGLRWGAGGWRCATDRGRLQI